MTKAAELRDLAGALDVDGTVFAIDGKSLELTGGRNVQWGGSYADGYPSIWGQSSLKRLRFAPNGANSGIVVEMSATGMDVTGDVTVSGDLVVNGNTVTLNTSTLEVEDKTITVALGSGSAATADGAGLYVDIVGSTNPHLSYDGTNDRWRLNKNTHITEADSTVYSTTSDTRIAGGRLFVQNTDNTTGSITGITLFTGSSSGSAYEIDAVRSSNAYQAALTFKARTGASTYSEFMRIDDTGRVGIAYDEPKALLHIGGANSNIGNETNPALQIGNDGNYRFGIYTTAEGAVVENKNGDDGITFLGKYAAGGVKVDKFGNLAIGSSFVGSNSVASYEIDVDGDIQARDSFRTQQVRHSIAPTLNLDFANSKQLDPRITFYRDSIATYYDSKGVLRYANHNEPRFDHDPATGESKGLLVEEQMTNEITYSVNLGNFAASASHKENLAGVAPDGTYSAVNHVPDTSTGYHNLTWNPSLTAGTPYTFSIYMKYTGGISLVRMSLYDNTNGYTGLAVFDIQNGTIELNSYGIGIIEDVGNGWYRCILVQNSTAFSSNTKYVWIAPSNSSGTTQAENGTDGYLLWGPQVEKAIFHTSYIPSDTRFTSRSSVATYHDENGVLRKAPVNVPRYGYKYDGYNWVETGLILEASSSSTARYTEDVSQWGRARVTVSTNVTTSPAGTENADKVVEDTQFGEHAVINYADVTAGNWTLSVYAKAAERDVLGIQMYRTGGEITGNPIAYFDLTDGSINSVSSSALDARSEYAGNGWWRLSITAEVTASATANCWMYLTDTTVYNAYTGDGSSGVYVWGSQVEQQRAPTSYISVPDSSTTTRSADVATGVAITREDDVAQITNKNFDFYNLKEGTTYVEAYPNASAATQYAPTTFAYWDGVGTDDRINMRFAGSFNAGTLELQAAVESFDSGLSSFYNPTTTGTGTRGTLFKGAISMSDNNFIATSQGDTSVGTLTSRIMPDVKQLTIGSSFSNSYQLNGHVKKLAYYDQQLTSAEIIALTENN